jgi:hypothetical protein
LWYFLQRGAGGAHDVKRARQRTGTLSLSSG